VTKKKLRDEREDDNDDFVSFDEELAQMRERMDRIFDAFMKNELGPDRAPMFYGLSMQIDQDGVPVVREFGNGPVPARIEGGKAKEREPLIDVLESDEQVRVIIGLPGVRKEDIRIEAQDRSLEVEVDAEERRFHEQIDLPCAVLPDSFKATYKNGVLEISIKRIGRKKGRKVRVE